MENKKQSINEAIEALHSLYGKVEKLYDFELMDVTRKSLSIVYIFLVRKRELEKEEPYRYLKVVDKT